MLISASAYSQTWSGSTSATGAAYRSGNVGIGASTTPRGLFDVNGTGDVYLAGNTTSGSTQTLYLPGHLYFSPYAGTNWSYLQARRSDDTGSTNFSFRTWNAGVLNEAMVLTSFGFLGLGTTTPSVRLHVAGAGGASTDVRITGRIHLGDAGESGGIWLNGAGTMLIGQRGTSQVGIYNNAAWRLVVTSAGDVGIGTNAPDAKLAVNGTIHAQEVKIDLAGWPDYVFADEYKLPSLETVERYIKQYKHLPDVPSATDVEANGINVGEMNALLLKKIEELTLYQIEAAKKMTELQDQVKRLELQVNSK
jgi:hypothetical protein